MKIHDKEFLRLQNYWYAKLEESGFKDIEKAEHSLYNLWYHAIKGSPQNEILLIAKREYFHLLLSLVERKETRFRNEIDRFILIRYANGKRIKQIIEELLHQGVHYHRHSIRFIIRRYEMLWKIKKYSRNQLNLKPKKSKSHHPPIQS